MTAISQLGKMSDKYESKRYLIEVGSVLITVITFSAPATVFLANDTAKEYLTAEWNILLSRA